ncbi:MAG TPA: Gfo/Idh/MocA family oxidoreductase [Armatimonadota bacterium]|nr:Gfo/Idh/MocA family oxidoreductase [Armatimonadota bacterium]
MFPSIFTDELRVDITEGLPIIKSWGLHAVDLRNMVFGKPAEALPPEELPRLRKLLDDHGMKVGCLESSLAKVHLPGPERCKAEEEKLEGIIRAADALDCRLVRAFFYWQPPAAESGLLAHRSDLQQQVLDRFAPLAERARQAGLTLAFENCGVTPDEVFAILDLLGVPGWGLAWDCHNSWDCDERRRDEDAYILRMVQRAKLVHVKATQAVPGTAEELIPYAKVLQACNNAGVAGPVSAETHNPDPSVSHVEMSRRTVEVIQKAWPSAAPGSLFHERRSTEGIARPWADNPVGFVVVGLGMGHNRAKMVTQTPGTRLVGVCDLIEERARRTGEECGVPYSTDLRRWLEDDQVEVVWVMTETGRHAEVAIQALEAGKHVLTTKPMEANVAACDAMIRAAEAKGLLLGVDLDRRHITSVCTLKAAVAQGRLGKLISGNSSLKVLRTMEYFRANGGWRGTKRWDGGGVLSNQAVHHVDEAAYTLGIPARVRCNVYTQTHDIEAEDLGTAVWEYDSGMVLTFYATTSYPHSTWYYQYELTGTDGAYLEVAGGPFEKPLIRWYIDGAWSEQPPLRVEPEWLNSADNFAAALRAGAELTCTGRDGRRTRAILDAMYRSAYECDGGWVDVEPEME